VQNFEKGALFGGNPQRPIAYSGAAEPPVPVKMSHGLP